MLYRIFDDMTQCSEQEVARLLPLVSAQRREQALRYKHTFGQYCCLQSYKMLCELLAEWSRVHQLPINQQPIFLYNDYGAPYIEGGPHFSISHCKRGIAVAVSENPIGIDIEGIRRWDEGLVRKTMNNEEQKLIYLLHVKSLAKDQLILENEEYIEDLIRSHHYTESEKQLIYELFDLNR